MTAPDSALSEVPLALQFASPPKKMRIISPQHLGLSEGTTKTQHLELSEGTTKIILLNIQLCIVQY